MTISSLEDLLRSMYMILEEQYNAERAKPPKHTSGTINTRHRPTTATEPTHVIDPNNVEQNLTTATEPTVILKYQTRIETEMTQIETEMNFKTKPSNLRGDRSDFETQTKRRWRNNTPTPL